MDEKDRLLYQHLDATSSQDLVGVQDLSQLSLYKRKTSYVHLISLYLCICILLMGLVISVRGKPSDPFLQLFCKSNMQ
jgi:hypothetical protein